MRSADPSPPVKFAGYDASGRPLPTQAAPADTNSVNTNSCTPQQRAAGGSVTGSGGGGSSRVVGVSWIDEQGKERVSRAPLTVVCDGRYSILRGSLSSAQPKTMSFMAGLLLRHSPDAGPNGILPYARRGHVILANPGIVLLYQISAMETRALVDIPGPLPNVEDGSLQRCVRAASPPPHPRKRTLARCRAGTSWRSWPRSCRLVSALSLSRPCARRSLSACRRSTCPRRARRPPRQWPARFFSGTAGT